MNSRSYGKVEGLFITDTAGAPMRAIEAVQAIAGRGLEGDRYCLGTGFYSNKHGWGANITLIESEAIAAINVGHNTNLNAAMLRRNVLSAGIRLESLIGRRFRCGDVVLLGTKAFPPCKHLADLLGDPAILKYLAYCGGIGAKIVSGGAIKLFDSISLISLEAEKH